MCCYRVIIVGSDDVITTITGTSDVIVPCVVRHEYDDRWLVHGGGLLWPPRCQPLPVTWCWRQRTLPGKWHCNLRTAQFMKIISILPYIACSSLCLCSILVYFIIVRVLSVLNAGFTLTCRSHQLDRPNSLTKLDRLLLDRSPNCQHGNCKRSGDHQLGIATLIANILPAFNF